jgi:hypothetical protein
MPETVMEPIMPMDIIHVMVMVLISVVVIIMEMAMDMANPAVMVAVITNPKIINKFIDITFIMSRC